MRGRRSGGMSARKKRQSACRHRHAFSRKSGLAGPAGRLGLVKTGRNCANRSGRTRADVRYSARVARRMSVSPSGCQAGKQVVSSAISHSQTSLEGESDAHADTPACHSRTLLWHARWTLPLHVVLPIGLWWLVQHDPGSATVLFVGIHAGFPILLIATVRWWWSRRGELIALLIINHLVSFVVLAVVAWCWSGAAGQT